MKKIIILVFVVTIFQTLSAQTKYHDVKGTKTVRLGYGGVFTGSGDMWGQKFLLGTQYYLSKHSLLDMRISASLIEHEFMFLNNPDWSWTEISNGVEFTLEYGFLIKYKRIRFYPSAGPAIRYSYEHHSRNYGIRRDKSTGLYIWHCEIDEDQILRFGYEVGINIDLELLKNYSIGPRVSFSQFPKGGYIFSFIGFSITKDFR